MTAAYPEFRTTRCVRYRYRYSACTRCADACPHDALAPHDAGVRIDEAKCRNCALCASACRTGALGSGRLDRIELVRRAIGGPATSVACAPSGVAADHVVGCLGALDAVMLAYLARRGIAVELRGVAACAACEHAPAGETQWRANVEAVAALASAAPPEPAWRLPAVVDGEAAAGRRSGRVSGARRQLFRRLVGRGADALAGATEPSETLPVPEKAIRPGPYSVTEQRELLRIVATRADGKPLRFATHEAVPLVDLALDAGCTACEACFRACPTGALAIEESPDGWALAFTSDHCVGCEVCIEVCQPRVLRAAADADATPGRGYRRLHRLTKQRCERCDRHFVSPRPRSTCDVCADDERAFDAIFG